MLGYYSYVWTGSVILMLALILCLLLTPDLGDIRESIVSVTYHGTVTALGIVLTEDGYILTSWHAANPTTVRSLEVVLFNGERYKPKLVYGSIDADLMLMKIGAKGLKPILWRNSGAIAGRGGDSSGDSFSSADAGLCPVSGR